MEVKEIVKENLVALRKANKMTQIDLAKKVNFSDKAISRWENGEVTPDIETLEVLSNIYSVPINYFFEKHDGGEIQAKKVDLPNQKTNKILYCIMSIMVVWTIATILFVYLETLQHIAFWQVFVWAVPVSALIFIYCNHKWIKIRTLSLVAQSVFIWSLLTSVYIQWLPYNLWLIYLIGVPLQVTIVARYFLK